MAKGYIKKQCSYCGKVFDYKVKNDTLVFFYKCKECEKKSKEGKLY